MFHQVYKTVNLTNGKEYIGIHSSQSLMPDDYLGSGIALKSAITKYGKGNFVRNTICFCDTRELAAQIEAREVNESYITRKDTYNMVVGGGNPPHVDWIGRHHKQETKEKISKTKTGMCAGAEHWFHKYPEQAAINAARFIKATHALAQEQAKTGIYSHTGHKHSQETKNTLHDRSSNRRWYTDGSKCIFSENICPIGWKPGRIIHKALGVV